MTSVTVLSPGEAVHLEKDQIVRLADQIGIEGADHAAHASIEEIVERLCAAEAAWQSGEFARLAEAARSLVGISDEVGMVTLSCVARAETVGPTGVEMEALTAVQTALLTVYDMCKAVDRGMGIGEIRLESKRGGKSGDWSRGSAE